MIRLFHPIFLEAYNLITFLGKGTVNLEANGISNVGKVHMEMGVGDTAVYIPGLSNLFIGKDIMCY